MKVKIKVGGSGPFGSFSVGDEPIVPDEIGQDLINAEYAELLDAAAQPSEQVIAAVGAPSDDAGADLRVKLKEAGEKIEELEGRLADESARADRAEAELAPALARADEVETALAEERERADRAEADLAAVKPQGGPEGGTEQPDETIVDQSIEKPTKKAAK